ncbi:MAG: hypothetical protein QM778_35275 [Myxococcales bacterium]
MVAEFARLSRENEALRKELEVARAEQETDRKHARLCEILASNRVAFLVGWDDIPERQVQATLLDVFGWLAPNLVDPMTTEWASRIVASSALRESAHREIRATGDSHTIFVQAFTDFMAYGLVSAKPNGVGNTKWTITASGLDFQSFLRRRRMESQVREGLPV